jgi:hypothetical protein
MGTTANLIYRKRLRCVRYTNAVTGLGRKRASSTGQDGTPSVLTSTLGAVSHRNRNSRVRPTEAPIHTGAMSPESLSPDADARLAFVAEPVALAELDLTVADLADPDVRSLVIRHEHPGLDRALTEGRRDVEVDGERINPRLHLAMHEIVATQLWDDDPPEVWATAARLLESGYDRHEILHMLAAPVAQQVWGTLHEERPYDRDRHVAELEALSGSWEQERATTTAARLHGDERKSARRAARAARRRNRRPR